MIEVRDLSLRAGAFTLEGVDLSVAQGEYAVLVGRTGTGKTCLLDAVCGLRPLRGGVVRLRGVDVTALDPADRGIGYVPQDGAMFAAMTVGDQIALPLRVRRVAASEAREQVVGIARELGIDALLERRPRGLSGGERQRVALARALVFQPAVLCLDEPLSALDEETREEMYEVILHSVRDRGATALHVTHSPSEARRLGSIGLRLEGGQVHPFSLKAEARSAP